MYSILPRLLIFIVVFAGCDDHSSITAQTPANTPKPTSAPAGMSRYSYLVADGGPHMLLPADAASAWTGAQSMRAVTNPKSDYGRAVAATANAQMGVIPVGSSSALVFADPAMTAWGTSADGLVEIYYIKSWTTMNLDALIAKATAALPTPALTNSGSVLQFREPDAFLLFAGDTPSSTAYGGYRVKIAPGKYKVLIGNYSSKGDAVTIYRLQPTGTAITPSPQPRTYDARPLSR